MKHITALFCAVLFSSSLFAGVVTTAVKTIPEAVEFAAKKSEKVLSPAVRKSAELALEKAVANYGDDVLKTVTHGGLESLEVGAKYGDDFWRLCNSATPDAIRSLALHADDLMPIAKRLGPDFMTLEGKVPGLGAKAVQLFGDDAAKALAKAPADDLAKLIGYAEKADNVETVAHLFKTYQKDSNFLKHLNWKTIMASGLSLSAITAAYKVSNGVEKGIEIAAEKSPTTFLIMISIIALVILALILWKIILFFKRK